MRGVDAYLVDVETNITNGLPLFSAVGLPDIAVRESKDRVEAAIKQRGFVYPYKRVTINLTPANVKKAGSLFDLPIAMGMLSATGQIQSDSFMEIKGNPVLITLARLEKRKGHAVILKAVKKLTSDFPLIQYVIAGAGSEKSNLQRLVKEYALENNVSFVGLVNEYQKKYLFEHTDLMVMPTIDDSENRSIEGFGIAYLEAAFFAIPSVASNVGGTKEAVLHNKTGIIINNIDDLFQSIHELLRNSSHRKQLGNEAQKRAIQDFNWDIVTNKYLNAINN